MLRIRSFKTRQLLLIALISCAPVLVAFVPATPQTAPEPFAAQVIAEIQARMPEWIKQRETPGAAVAVVDDKSVL